MLNLFFFGVYKYYIAKIDTSKIRQYKPYNYKADVYRTYWVTFASSSDMEMKGFYSFDVFVAIYKDILSKNIKNRYKNNSLTLCQFLSLHGVYGKKLERFKGNAHFERIIYSIWMTHHFKSKELMDILFSKTYYANGYNSLESASKGYFHKEVNNLTIYELLMLQSITYAPNSLNPRRHKEGLLKRFNKLINKAKVIFPVRYMNIEKQNKLPKFFNY